MSNTYIERIGKLTIRVDFLQESETARVSVHYNRIALVVNQILDEKIHTYPFSYYPGTPPKPVTEGVLELNRDPQTGLSELTVALSFPHEKTIKIQQSSSPETS